MRLLGSPSKPSSASRALCWLTSSSTWFLHRRAEISASRSSSRRCPGRAYEGEACAEALAFGPCAFKPPLELLRSRYMSAARHPRISIDGICIDTLLSGRSASKPSPNATSFELLHLLPPRLAVDSFEAVLDRSGDPGWRRPPSGEAARQLIRLASRADSCLLAISCGGLSRGSSL